MALPPGRSEALSSSSQCRPQGGSRGTCIVPVHVHLHVHLHDCMYRSVLRFMAICHHRVTEIHMCRYMSVHDNTKGLILAEYDSKTATAYST